MLTKYLKTTLLPPTLHTHIKHFVLPDSRIITACILTTHDDECVSYGQAVYSPTYGIPFNYDLGAKIAIGRAHTACKKYYGDNSETYGNKELSTKKCKMTPTPHYTPVEYDESVGGKFKSIDRQLMGFS